MFEISARHLAEHEGYDNVRNWLVNISQEPKLEIAGMEALRRFDALEWSEEND